MDLVDRMNDALWILAKDAPAAIERIAVVFADSSGIRLNLQRARLEHAGRRLLVVLRYADEVVVRSALRAGAWMCVDGLLPATTIAALIAAGVLQKTVAA